mgnify:CR=1 FL=1
MWEDSLFLLRALQALLWITNLAGPKGVVSVVPLPTPPPVQAKPQLFRNPYKATSDTLTAA